MTTLEEFEARLAVLLDEVRTVRGSPRAAVNANGTPAHVAAGTLIESAWGNAVVDSLLAYHGVGLTANTFSAAAGSTVDLQWGTESWDSDAYYSGGIQITVPATRFGIYSTTFQLNQDVGNGPTHMSTLITAPSSPTRQLVTVIPTGGTAGHVTGVIRMPAGTTVSCRLWNASSTTLNYSAFFELYRVAFNE